MRNLIRAPARSQEISDSRRSNLEEKIIIPSFLKRDNENDSRIKNDIYDIKIDGKYGDKFKKIKENQSIYLFNNPPNDRENNEKIITENNYQLEELIENYRENPRGRQEIIRSIDLERIVPRQNIGGFGGYNLSSPKLQKTLSLDETAEKLAGSDPVALKRELTKFRRGESVDEFGVLVLQGFLKQGYAVEGMRPGKNTGDSNPEVLIPASELMKYGLRLDMQSEGSHYGRHFGKKYFDTMFNFCLTYEGELIASVGFDAEAETVFVEQIQGIKGHGDKLKPFKWERALLNYAFEWAKQNGVPNVAVVSVDNNRWAKNHGHLDKEQGRMLYDVTAKRSGFKKAEDGNYVRSTFVEQPATDRQVLVAA